MRTLLRTLLKSKSKMIESGPRVSAKIAFSCRKVPTPAEMQNFRHEINTAYSESPWRSGDAGVHLPALIKIDEGTVFSTDAQTITKPVPVTISADYGCYFSVVLDNLQDRIERPALHAYEQHVRDLGATLATRKLMNVICIETTYEMTSRATHWPPND